MDRQDDSRHENVCIIRDINDKLRREMPHGRVLLTRAIANLDPSIAVAIVCAVREFDAFTPDNDRWGEHDFGQIQIGGETYFWKIDAYDVELEFESPDPTDDAVTKRILTIMTAGAL
jgi:hypothetical protein